MVGAGWVCMHVSNSFFELAYTANAAGIVIKWFLAICYTKFLPSGHKYVDMCSSLYSLHFSPLSCRSLLVSALSCWADCAFFPTVVGCFFFVFPPVCSILLLSIGSIMLLALVIFFSFLQSSSLPSPRFGSFACDSDCVRFRMCSIYFCVNERGVFVYAPMSCVWCAYMDFCICDATT